MELIYIWIEDYRNIYKQGFNLSSKWEVEFDEGENKISINSNPKHVEGFFPAGITNVTAVVGENGAGKSNLLSFIADWVGVRQCQEKCLYVIKDGNDFHIMHDSAYKVREYNIEIEGETFKHTINPFSDHSTYTDSSGIFWSDRKDNLLKIIYANSLDGKTIIHPGFSNVYNISNDYRLQNLKYAPDKELELTSEYENYQNQDIESIFRLLENTELTKYIPFETGVPKLSITFQPIVNSFTELAIFSSDLYARTSSNQWGLDQFKENYLPWFEQTGDLSQLDKLFVRFDEIRTPEEIEEHIFKVLLINFFVNLGRIFAKMNEKNGVSSPFIYTTTPNDFKSGKEFLSLFFTEHDDDKPALELIETIASIIKSKSERGTLDDDFDQYNKRLALTREEYISFRSSLNKYLFLFNEKARSFAYTTYLQSRSFIRYQWDYFSTGQLAFLRLFARLLEIPFYRQGKPGGLPEWNRVESVILILDESELGFHPQWQRFLVDYLLEMSPKIFDNQFIQIILASHSPFVLSDLTDDHAILLRQGKENDSPYKGRPAKGLCFQSSSIEGTFAANIHSLFAHSFFLNDGFIGISARKKLKRIISYLGEDSSSEENTNDPLFSFPGIKNLIEKVGEPIIREKLWELFRKKFEDKLIDEKINELKREIEKLEQQKGLEND